MTLDIIRLFNLRGEPAATRDRTGADPLAELLASHARVRQAVLGRTDARRTDADGDPRR